MLYLRRNCGHGRQRKVLVMEQRHQRGPECTEKQRQPEELARDLFKNSDRAFLCASKIAQETGKSEQLGGLKAYCKSNPSQKMSLVPSANSWACSEPV